MKELKKIETKIKMLEKPVTEDPITWIFKWKDMFGARQRRYSTAMEELVKNFYFSN